MWYGKPGMPDQFIFITGMMRSGTTLLEKLLSNHPRLSVLSQPFPMFWIEQKREFLATLGFSDPIPLGNLFGETRYTPRDFEVFLNEQLIPAAFVRKCLAAQKNYSGGYTRLNVDAFIESGDDKFLNWVRHLLKKFAHRSGVNYFGSKEVLCEEYLPALIHCGFKCLLVVRNPNDVIASLNYGKASEYSGPLRPTLFSIRQWRKSVWFSILLKDHANFKVIRFEDLVTAPTETLDAITDFLGIESFGRDAFEQGIPDQHGERWQANSSHFRSFAIDTRAVEAYRAILPLRVRQYVQAACAPEMRYLDYAAEKLDDPKKVIRDFSEPVAITRSEFPPDYSMNEDNLAMELQRIDLLNSDSVDDAAVIGKYFLCRAVYDALSKVALP